MAEEKSVKQYNELDDVKDVLPYNKYSVLVKLKKENLFHKIIQIDDKRLIQAIEGLVISNVDKLEITEVELKDIAEISREETLHNYITPLIIDLSKSDHDIILNKALRDLAEFYDELDDVANSFLNSNIPIHVFTNICKHTIGEWPRNEIWNNYDIFKNYNKIIKIIAIMTKGIRHDIHDFDSTYFEVCISIPYNGIEMQDHIMTLGNYNTYFSTFLYDDEIKIQSIGDKLKSLIKKKFNFSFKCISIGEYNPLTYNEEYIKTYVNMFNNHLDVINSAMIQNRQYSLITTKVERKVM